MEIVSAFCPVHRGHIAYSRCGSGPAVVFLHGIGGNRQNWAPQLQALGTSYACIAWDAMGYGESTDAEDATDFAHFYRELDEFLDSLGIRRAHLVGLSMGGHIALGFYKGHAPRVATLTLAATSAGMATLSMTEREQFVTRRTRPLRSGSTPSDVAPSMIDVLVGRKATGDVRELLTKSLSAVRAEPYIDTVNAIVKTDFRDVLPSIDVPVLVIVGEEDKVLPVSESAYLADHIPAASLKVLPGVGHLCNLEAPGDFSLSLLQFLNQHRQLGTDLS